MNEPLISGQPDHSLCFPANSSTNISKYGILIIQGLSKVRKVPVREEVNPQSRLVHPILLLLDVLFQLFGSIQLDPGICLWNEGGPAFQGKPADPNYDLSLLVAILCKSLFPGDGPVDEELTCLPGGWCPVILPSTTLSRGYSSPRWSFSGRR